MTIKPSAFVLMPFSNRLNTVYEHFFKPVLEEAGFNVFRADDLASESQQSILRDILDGIHKNDLIVADLTDLNPNVFYELGLAHALGKPVILLTQQREEVPFDLRQYRLTEYSTHFVEIKEAEARLSSLAKGFLDGTAQFGNPVTDFLPEGSNALSPDQHLGTNEESSGENDDLGVLDHLIRLSDGYNLIASILKASTADMTDLTASLEESTQEISLLNSRPHAGTARAIRAWSRRLAGKISDFTTKSRKNNAEYGSILETIEDGLEFVLAFRSDGQSDSNEVNELIEMLPSFEKTAIEARDSYLELAAQMESLPRIERRLNQSVASGGEEVLAMASNIDRHIASVSRARRKYGI